MTDENNMTQGATGGQQDDGSPIITPTGEDGSLPTGLGEPIDTTSVKIPMHVGTTFDEQEFLRLLSGSISLTKTEKLKIIESLPRLSQDQINRLIEIFKEEQVKFSQLEVEHAEEISELEVQKMAEWKSVENTQAEESEKDAEARKIAELQAKLLNKNVNNSEDENV